MKPFRFIFLFLALSHLRCDSTVFTENDKFLGTWICEQVLDLRGDQTPRFERAFRLLRVSFQARGLLFIIADFTEREDLIMKDQTWSIEPLNQVYRMNFYANDGSLQQKLNARYALYPDGQLGLLVSAQDFAQLFGIYDFQGMIELRFKKIN